MSGPGKILVEHNRGGIWGRLYNFDTGSVHVKTEHQTFLREKVAPILIAGGSLRLIGLASRLDDPGRNKILSRHRVDAVIAALRSTVHRSFSITRNEAAGEQEAINHGVRNERDNSEIWRSVIFSAWNRFDPPPPPPVHHDWTTPPPTFHDPNFENTPHYGPVRPQFRIRLLMQVGIDVFTFARFQVHDRNLNRTAYYRMAAVGADVAPVSFTSQGDWSVDFFPQGSAHIGLENLQGVITMFGGAVPPVYSSGSEASSVTWLTLHGGILHSRFIPINIRPFPTGMTIPGSFGVCGGVLHMDPSTTFPYPGPEGEI